jgi:glycopeptide antibiotics resistance protein
MGRKEVRVVRVRRWVTIVLLTLVSLLLVALVHFLSGKAYLRERAMLSLFRARTPEGALASLAPAIANLLPLVPWGFLGFLAFDRDDRSRLHTYVLTALGALAFCAAVDAWQFSLPTRVTGWLDLPWNVLGALCGATLGHARKRVRIHFA